MTTLDPQQAAAVSMLAEVSDEYRTARVHLRTELARRLEEELAALKTRRAILAFKAHQLGVPKRRIGLEGLGTTDPKTPAAVIEEGRLAISGTLDDPQAKVAILDAHQPPKENPFVHPRGGFFADVEPWPLRASDKPGVVILSAYGDDDGVKRDEPHEVELQLSEAGTVQTVEIMAPLNAVIHHPKWGKPVRDAALVIFKAMGENV